MQITRGQIKSAKEKTNKLMHPIRIRFNYVEGKHSEDEPFDFFLIQYEITN